VLAESVINRLFVSWMPKRCAIADGAVINLTRLTPKRPLLHCGPNCEN
jgi:hypothetical protein